MIQVSWDQMDRKTSRARMCTNTSKQNMNQLTHAYINPTPHPRHPATTPRHTNRLRGHGQLPGALMWDNISLLDPTFFRLRKLKSVSYLENVFYARIHGRFAIHRQCYHRVLSFNNVASHCDSQRLSAATRHYAKSSITFLGENNQPVTGLP